MNKSEIPRDKRYQTSDLSRRVKKNMDRMRNDPNHPHYVGKVLKLMKKLRLLKESIPTLKLM